METQADRWGLATASDALDALMSGPLGTDMAPAAQVARAWYAANGDRERRHTTGVWLRKASRTGADPVLVVALDSNLMAQELGTNKSLYLQRLAFRGVCVSDIRFTVGAGGRASATGGYSPSGSPATGGVSPSGTPVKPLPELTEAERDRVSRACEGLPDGLRQSASRAMSASLRRSKAQKG